MEPDRLFVETLGDLNRRVTKQQDEYEVLLSAALLRKLLMDETPLMDRVNASRRLRVTFLINDVTPYEKQVLGLNPIYWSLEDGIDAAADRPPGMRLPVEAKRDQLLARPVMRLQGETVTVRDLIDDLAHIEGAVHSKSPRERREELLGQVSKQIYIGGLPAGIRQIRSIGRVVHRGLEPLRDAVLANS